MDYSFSAKSEVFVITLIGRLTKTEVLAFWDLMEQQTEYNTTKSVLVLLRSLWWEMTREEIEELAAMGKRLRPVRLAFAVDEDFSFQLVEAFTSSLIGTATMRAFRSEADALNWLSAAGYW